MAEKTKSAVLVLDAISPYDFEDADVLATSAAEAVEPLAALTERAREEDVPVIYVNDNFGDWNSSAEELAKHALDGRHPELVEPILPADGDSFVIKARHSGFYETPLEYLLRQLEITRLVLTGQATEQCVLYTALDAYVRHFEVIGRRRCVRRDRRGAGRGRPADDRAQHVGRDRARRRSALIGGARPSCARGGDRG